MAASGDPEPVCVSSAGAGCSGGCGPGGVSAALAAERGRASRDFGMDAATGGSGGQPGVLVCDGTGSTVRAIRDLDGSGDAGSVGNRTSWGSATLGTSRDRGARSLVPAIFRMG